MPSAKISGAFKKVGPYSDSRIVLLDHNGHPFVYNSNDGLNWLPGAVDNSALNVARLAREQEERSEFQNLNRSNSAAKTAVGGALGSYVAGRVGSTMRKASSERNSTAMLFIIIATVFAVAVIVSPGMWAVTLLKALVRTKWDFGQIWIFSIAASIVIWLLLLLLTRRVKKAGVIYLITCAIAAALFVFCAVGLKTEFTVNAFGEFFPGLASQNQVQQNASKSAERPSPTASAAIEASSPATYKVIGISQGDYLNVREGPGSSYRIVTRISSSTQGIRIGGGRIKNGTTTWQQISVDGFSGWANADFLSAED